VLFSKLRNFVLRFEVGGKNLLVAFDGFKQVFDTVVIRIRKVVVALQVTFPRPLYLDHPGAHVGKLQARQRTRQELAHVDNQDAIQWQIQWICRLKMRCHCSRLLL
jgi:hypothetical protein